MIMSFFVIAHAQAQLMGGFKSIAVDDAQVIKAAEFGMASMEETDDKYKDVTFTVTDASRQVVAGLNYLIVVRPTLATCEDITFKIWDHFGTYKVTEATVSAC